MGKMKEIFMKTNYLEYDLEREYFINDVIAQEEKYHEFLRLKNSPEMNQPLTAKIEVKHGAKIEINSKEPFDNQQIEVTQYGL